MVGQGDVGTSRFIIYPFHYTFTGWRIAKNFQINEGGGVYGLMINGSI